MPLSAALQQSSLAAPRWWSARCIYCAPKGANTLQKAETGGVEFASVDFAGGGQVEPGHAEEEIVLGGWALSLGTYGLCLRKKL